MLLYAVLHLTPGAVDVPVETAGRAVQTGDHEPPIRPFMIVLGLLSVSQRPVRFPQQ